MFEFECMRSNRLRKILVISIISMFFVSPFLSIMPVSAISFNFDASVNPQALVAGTNNTVIFVITNNGDSTSQDTLATLSFSSTGGLTSGGSLMLVNSDGKWLLGSMKPGQSATIVATIYAQPSAAGSISTLTMTVQGTVGGSSSNQRLSLYVDVASRDLSGASISPSFSNPVLVAAQNSTLNLILNNTGINDATNVTVKLNMPGQSSSSSSSLGGSSSLLSGLTGGSSSFSSGSTQFGLINTEGNWNIAKIGKGQSASIPFTIYTSPGAAGSIFLFSVELTYTDGAFNYISETRYVSARVPSVASSSSNFDAQFNTQDFKAGGFTDFNLTVTNTGSTTAEGVTVQLGTPGASLSSSSQSSSYMGTSFSIPTGSSSTPFIIVGDDGSWNLGNIGPGESRLIPVRVFAGTSAAGTISSFTVAISYTDYLAKSKQESKSIGVMTKGTVDLLVLDTSTFPSNVTIGKAFSVSVNLINLGSSDAASMIITPMTSGSLTPATSTNIFLGDVEKNVPSSFTMSYIAQDIPSGKYNISIVYTYKDSLGQKLNGTLDVPVKITIGNTSSSTNGTQTQTGIIAFLINYWPYLVFIIVLIIVLIFIRLSRKSRSKQ